MEYGYIRVEYIQNIAGSRIETNYIPTQNDEFEIEYMQDQSVVGDNFQCLLSAGTGTYQLIALAYGDTNDTNYYCKYFASGGAQTLRSHHHVNTWIRMKITSSGVFMANGISVTSPYEQEIDGSSNTLWIFRRKNNYSRFYGKLRSFKITNNGSLKMNLIPCIRSVDNVAGVYDTVSNVFYSSPDGLEPFEHGDPVVDNYLIGNVSGDIAHFRTALEEPLGSCKVSFEPVQAGSGDPSPSNVRAISGWNSITVKHCGKNFFNPNVSAWDTTSGIYPFRKFVKDGQKCSVSYSIKNASIDSSGLYWGFCEYPPITVDGTNQINKGYSWIIEKGVDKNRRTNAITYPPSESGKYGSYMMMFPTGESTVNSVASKYNIQVEYGSNATAYEPYQEDETTVSWQTSAGTVYGGYIDFVTGELVQTWSAKDMSTMNIGCDSGASYFYITGLDKAIGRDNILCPIYKYSTDAPASMPDFTIKGQPHNTNIFLKDSRYTGNVAGLKSALAGVMMAYELATPVRYQLTPQQINTFKGINNFWSEAGTIDVSYCFKDAPEMLKLRRQIELSSPHVESAIGEIANFKADMAAPLKSCKVSFEPIQAGEGDPSPDNIRAISGRTGLELTHSGVNLLKCDTFTNYTSAGITYTGTRNAEGEIESIRVTGTTTQANCFRNLNYGGGKYFKVFEGKTATYGYSNQVGVIALGDSGSFYINGKVYTSYNYTDWNQYDIDDQTYNSQHTAKNTATWYRLQTYPYQANVAIDTTVYPMVCLASDAGCDFEPYHGENISVDWQSQAGTVYGGYIDFVTGELVKIWVMKHVSGNESWYIDKYDGLNKNNRAYVTGFGPRGMTSRQIISDKITYSTQAYPPPVNCGKINENGVLMIGVPDTMDTSEDVNAWIQSIGGFDVAYPLDAPVRYQLTPQIIRSFKGRNNFWSDAGEVEAKYWTH